MDRWTDGRWTDGRDTGSLLYRMDSADNFGVPCLIANFKDTGLVESIEQLCLVTNSLRESVAQHFDKGINVDTDAKYWACKLKRQPVAVRRSECDSSGLLNEGDHNLGEIINQCATLARLIDAMTWARNSESYRDCKRVVSCDPTQSNEDVADLIVKGPRMILAFEVSDVIGKAFRKKVEDQTDKLKKARETLQGRYPGHSVRCFIAMNRDGRDVPDHATGDPTAIWEIK